jgi:hypothetical protein
VFNVVIIEIGDFKAIVTHTDRKFFTIATHKLGSNVRFRDKDVLTVGFNERARVVTLVTYCDLHIAPLIGMLQTLRRHYSEI